jgi:hypothetical protein
MESKKYTELEQEVIVLAAVWDLIGSMVHYGNFEKEHEVNSAILMFRTKECSELFGIFLADFLSAPRPGAFGISALRGKGSFGKTYLGHLHNLLSAPKFKGDTTHLSSSVVGFADWLDGFIEVSDVCLPSIERNGPLRVQRMAYLKICGTISKHGFTRLGGIVSELQRILRENKTEIDEGEGYLLIPDFRVWFQEHVYLASSTTIAWFLNEIRWGIFEYLRTEYKRAYRPTHVITGAQMYEYDVPSQITKPLVRSMYWDLMNEVRVRPYFPRFTVHPAYADQY